MLETLVTIVSLAKLAELHSEVLNVEIFMRARGRLTGDSLANDRHQLLTDIRGALAIVGLDPDKWATVSYESKHRISWI